MFREVAEVRQAPAQGVVEGHRGMAVGFSYRSPFYFLQPFDRYTQTCERTLTYGCLDGLKVSCRLA